MFPPVPAISSLTVTLLYTAAGYPAFFNSPDTAVVRLVMNAEADWAMFTEANVYVVGASEIVL